MKNLTFANRWNADAIDQYYEIWLRNPSELDPYWLAFFEGFELGRGYEPKKPSSSAFLKTENASDTLSARVIGAIYAYRALGHSQAKINPLVQMVISNPRLSLENLGLSQEDLEKTCYTGNYLSGVNLQVKDLLDRLHKTYCGHVGCEYVYIDATEKRRWLETRMESSLNQPHFSHEKTVRILAKIIEAESFENFLHTRFVGQKRFSLEGAETLIACLDALIQKSPEVGLKEIVIGMAHRGRLNVLGNIMRKSCNFIFREFSENYIPKTIYGDGDVKYHLGYETKFKTISQDIVEIRLAANPSHLEAVNPIVQGKARARQRILQDIEKRNQVMPILIHGDAAMAGQGIVAEVFNLSKLKGYTTGGTIHFVINNQIGFTTNPSEGRSSPYCTDVAKMVNAPIFHVNGEDPLAVVMVTELALEYRQKFGEDVVIDMYCYRKHGHNESDEPVFTQPTLYQEIAQKKLISEQLAETLISEGSMTRDEVDHLKGLYEDKLQEMFDAVKKEEGEESNKKLTQIPVSAHFQKPYSFKPIKTAVALKELKVVAKALTHIPETFSANSKIRRQFDARWSHFQAGENLEWSFAELLAFGSLLQEGVPIRLSGQDSERGTFSQRHSVLYDSNTRERYIPLRHISPDQEVFCVHNSCLSEAAVLGFDYGYSLDYPDMLCLWEAQFGDFANGAQVIIDQFIASGESKWQSLSNIVLLLPHGYEGQGPEHSSARFERFLQLCANDNLQVCNLSTPAQYFHVLRKQILQPYKKPLILMTPKSLLRHKNCVSSVEDLTKGQFHYILDDDQATEKTKRVIFCTGKVFYDLLLYRESHLKSVEATAIVRIEQLYPLDEVTLLGIFKKYSHAKTWVWCQEEPKNMGAWTFISDRIELIAQKSLRYVGRAPAASPATGSLARHRIEQASLIENAFVVQ